MCRPGEQFILRREAFARIQKAFQENGIVFASPRVTVDSEGEAEGTPGTGLSGAAAKAAASRVAASAQRE